jgi:hypothetical protein
MGLGVELSMEILKVSILEVSDLCLSPEVSSQAIVTACALCDALFSLPPAFKNEFGSMWRQCIDEN